MDFVGKLDERRVLLAEHDLDSHYVAKTAKECEQCFRVLQR
jgi:hypothetical protein